MCSATQAGLRVRRSKAEVVDGVGWRSETGPGKPYWKRPEGWTGAISSLEGVGGIGTGGWGVVGADRVVVSVDGVVVVVVSFFC